MDPYTPFQPVPTPTLPKPRRGMPRVGGIPKPDGAPAALGYASPGSAITETAQPPGPPQMSGEMPTARTAPGASTLPGTLPGTPSAFPPRGRLGGVIHEPGVELPPPEALPPPERTRPVLPPGTLPITPLIPRTGPAKTFGLPSTGDKFGPENDMRFTTIRPTTSARQNAAATATDAAAKSVADFNPDTAIDANLTRFNKQLDTPDVAFDKVNTDVSRRAVDPNVAYRGVNTNVNRRAVDPNVGFNGVQTDVDAGPSVAPTDSAELAKARGYQMNAADAIANGPDRRSIAEDTLSAFDTRAQPQIQKQMRAVGQQAASLGRIGMGETAIETLQPFTDYLTEREALSKDLAAETAEGDIADRRNNLSDFRTLTESTSGLDAGRRGEERTERSNVQDITGQNIARRTGERDTALGLTERNTGRAMDESAADAAVDADNIARTMAERDTRTGLEERNLGRDMDESDADYAAGVGNVTRRQDERNAGVANAQQNATRRAAARSTSLSAGINAADLTGSTRRSNLSTLSGVEGDVDTRARADRTETRGERTYQSDTARQAVEDAIRQHLIEQQDTNTDFDQQLALLRATNGDMSALINGSNRSGQSAADNYESMQKLLSYYPGPR